MSPRSRTPRKISEPPLIKGFKPYGGKLGNKEPASINLLLEEYEALRLCDYDRFNHEQAAELMGVSRPTFTRIYASALEKIAESFVLGLRIIIEGGHIYFDSKWCYCNDCKSKFSNPSGKNEKMRCPLCGSPDVTCVKEDETNETLIFRCDDCGIIEEVTATEAISEHRCPQCRKPMKPELLAGCNSNKCI
jgi:predicted DNA-binding protein (UPF0251 family)